MAEVAIEIGGRAHSVVCRDGEEPHLRRLALIVDGKAREAQHALGNVNEVRQLLFAALLLADEVMELREAAAKPPAPPAPGTTADDSAIAAALERLADRMDDLRERLEGEPPAP